MEQETLTPSVEEKAWISINEQMPENGKECKVKGFSRSGKPKEGTAFYHPAISWFGSFNGNVTHWKYLSL